MGSPGVLLAAALLLHDDDSWRVPVLEGEFDSCLRALAEFPAPLYPPDLEKEAAADLEELARLDPESAAGRARSLLGRVSAESGLIWTARRVLAESGDLPTIRLALASYFDAPQAWGAVLAASRDPRLRDFGERKDSREPTELLFLTTLERNLARARERSAVRTLLAWASAAADPSAPHRVLAALPEGIPLEAEVRGWLQRNPGPEEAKAPQAPGFTADEGPIAIQQRVLALPPEARSQALASLAETDHQALLGLSLSSDDVDRLYPYLARSSRRTVREWLRNAGRERGRALASLALSSAAGPMEKQDTLRAMPDAWAGAIARGGAAVYEQMTSLLPREDIERFLAESGVDSSFLDSLAIVPLPEARLRLEAIGTSDAVDRLVKRTDLVLSIPALRHLQQAGTPSVSRSAALALLSVGAPGSSVWLQGEMASLSDLTPLLDTVIRASGDPGIAVELVRRVASSSAHSPSGFAALTHLPLVDLGSTAEGPLAERVRGAMSIGGDRRYLPLLVDLAAGSVAGASRPSRDAAFAALAEVDLGSFATRLHRLAGDPDRAVRFQAAAALVPSGDAWTMRLLLGNLDASSSAERARARYAVGRLARERARELLEAMIADGTAGSFGVLLYLDLVDEGEARRSRSLQARLFRAIADDARAGDETAVLAASRLSHPGAIAVVTTRLSARREF